MQCPQCGGTGKVMFNTGRGMQMGQCPLCHGTGDPQRAQAIKTSAVGCGILFMAAVIVLVVIIGMVTTKIQSSEFEKEVKELFSLSKNISQNTFHYEQLSSLPEPVQKYFRHVLHDGQPYISYVRLTHDGQYKINQSQSWMNIEGERYFTAEKPGFIWKAKTRPSTFRQTYLADKGRLVLTFFSLKIVDNKGEVIDREILSEWLAGSVWFPTNLLPNKQLEWSVIDSNSAGLAFNYRNLRLSFKVTFNNNGEITQLETKRSQKTSSSDPWIATLSDYKEINGITVPTTFDATFKLQSGDFNYAKIHVKNIEYNKPERY